MIKKLASLLFAVSTTVSAQFVVNDDGVDYTFLRLQAIKQYNSLEVGDVVYTDKLNICVNPENKLVVNNEVFDSFQSTSSLYKITYIDEGTISIESILEQDHFLLNGPAIKLLEKFDESENIRCGWPNRLKVESLFGYNSFSGLLKGVEKDLKERYKGNFGVARLLPEILPETIE
ncbi:hypothetical protein [Zooshikella sp. RANM57]|uniref:hypothetical protein n=1 Tax=Zooshikella sp. RANM57 TaxID=3425863 RepID=UPI003D6E4514